MRVLATSTLAERGLAGDIRGFLPSPNPLYFPYLDGIRALAIIAVVLFHFDDKLLPGGLGGVDAFFIVSGFVVSASLHDIQFKRFRDLLTFFYARRMRRILPALAVMILATSLLTVLFVPRAWLSDHIKATALAAFFGYSNVWLALNGGDYFAPTAEYNPFTHTWSLGVEEQFYLIFPLFYFALTRSARIARLALFGLTTLSLASLAYGASKIGFNFYLIFGRFWELGAGVGLYALLVRWGRFLPKSNAPRETRIASYSGAALIAAGFIIGDPSLYPVPGALLPVVGTMLLILGLHARAPCSFVAAILNATPMLWIGRISYSLYLWHWPTFVLFRWTTGFETLAQKLLALGIAVTLSVISYELIETPFRRARTIRQPALAIGASLGILMVCWLGAQMFFANQGHLSQSVVMRHRADWFPRDFALMDANGCRIERQIKTLSSGIAAITERKSCPPPAQPTTLFVIGDSHADAYQPLLAAYALETGTRVVTYYKSYHYGCSFIKLMPVTDFECTRAIEAALDDIRSNARSGDILFMPSLRLFRFRDQADERPVDAVAQLNDPSLQSYRRSAVEDAVGLLAGLSEKGVKLVFELPKPIFRTPLFRCSDWFNRSNPICSEGTAMERDYLESYRAPIVAAAEEIRKKLPLFYTWDPFQVLCPETPCRMMREGRPLFFDGDHLTGYANRLLLPDFVAMLDVVMRAAPREKAPSTITSSVKVNGQ